MTALTMLFPTAILPSLQAVAQPEDMKPGAWAFVIVAGLLIVTVLLWFSLRKQLRRIEVPPENTDDNGEDPGPSDQ